VRARGPRVRELHIEGERRAEPPSAVLAPAPAANESAASPSSDLWSVRAWGDGGVVGWEEAAFAQTHGSKTSARQLLRTQTCVVAHTRRRPGAGLGSKGGVGLSASAQAGEGGVVTGERTRGSFVCLNLASLNASGAGEAVLRCDATVGSAPPDARASGGQC